MNPKEKCKETDPDIPPGCQGEKPAIARLPKKSIDILEQDKAIPTKSGYVECLAEPSAALPRNPHGSRGKRTRDLPGSGRSIGLPKQGVRLCVCTKLS
jgi:hypothetical protein